jgi:redox-sensitive bicupin YhaK (pirin superfamily)
MAAPASWSGGDANDAPVKIHQDAFLYATILEPGQEVAHKLPPGRSAWLQVARGAVQVDGNQLHQGDGAALSEQSKIAIRSAESSEVLLFDLA